MTNGYSETLKYMKVEDLNKAYCQPLNSIVSSSLTDKVHITALILYPVKGCMAFSVNKWPVHDSGLYLDRHWCIKSLKSGKFFDISKRKDSIIIHQYLDLKNNLLILATQGMDKNLLIKVNEEAFCRIEGGQLHSIVVDGEKLEDTLEDCGDEAANWINEALFKDDCRLLRQIQLRNDKLSLVGESHIQVMNISSLEDLIEGMAREQGFVETNLSELCIRFRPNIVVGGLKKYEETTMDHLSIKGVQLKAKHLVERCMAVNLDCDRFDYEINPLKYLVKSGGGVAKFGLYVSVLDCNDNEVINVGDKVLIDI